MAFTLSFVIRFILFMILLGLNYINMSAIKCPTNHRKHFDFALCQDVSADYFCAVGHETREWLKSLYSTALNDVTTPVRKRQELRTLTEQQRQAFYDAINALKQDTSIYPNKYDALALIHTNITICTAHAGSSFMGWHRMYLIMLETALRQKDSSVSIPYWASTLDNNDVTPPNKNILFTENFIGNGYGKVTTGPFADWRDEKGYCLDRDIAKENRTFMSPEIIDSIMYSDNITNMDQVVSGTHLSPDNETIEGQHNLIHDWIGGMMGYLELAPRDPSFYLHHAYVDYIWEKFREKQQRLGINPETSYHALVDTNLTHISLHNSDRLMDCFPWMTNAKGLSNNFTGKMYTYEELPTCPSCGNSKFLACNKKLGRCIGVDSSYNVSSGNSIHISSEVIFILMLTVNCFYNKLP